MNNHILKLQLGGGEKKKMTGILMSLLKWIIIFQRKKVFYGVIDPAN